MIEKIIEWSMRNPLMVLLGVALSLMAGVWAVKTTPLDVLPDLSPPQVIVEANWAGQSPQVMNDQVTNVLVTRLLSVPQVDTVRAFSSFETAMIYVIFKDGVDLYFGRERVLEKLAELSGQLPAGASAKMGPDATGVGWVYQYALTSQTRTLDELRTLQDFFIRYALLSVDGVSEVSSVGGFVKDYQIVLDQSRLVQYDTAVDEVARAVRENNNDVGGRVVLENGFEHIVIARGYVREPETLENLTVKTINGTPLKVRDLGHVEVVPAGRRGTADLNGEGEVVGGIVVARFGENAYAVIERVKEKLAGIIPADVELVTTYDRSSLIDAALDTLKRALTEESLIVMAIIALFLLHFRSSLIIIVTLPITIVYTFLLMRLAGVESNIMSLGGIAIAIGAMVDAGIVMVENAHKTLHHKGENITAKERFEAILHSSKQVGRPIFFALILIVVSFLPVFALTGQEGKLFSPMAYTKTFAMLAGAVLAITLVPVMMVYLLRGRIKGELENPINRFFVTGYSPMLKTALRFPKTALLVFAAIFLAALPLYNQIKWEFMPPLNERSVMYMPVTGSGIGVDLARELTQETDRLIKSFPEVENVFGKAGRADTSTDPAPLSMIETIITFKPESEWREGMTWDKLLDEMEATVQLPGLINSWTWPIRGRIDMLLTGIRTPMGIKLYGQDSAELERLAKAFEAKLAGYAGTQTAFAERSNQGYYLALDTDEERLSRYGVTKEAIFMALRAQIGGEQVSTRLDNLENYPITIRLAQADRGDVTALGNVMIKTALGWRPLRELAEVRHERSPAEIKTEKAQRVAFIFITPRPGVSPKTYEEEMSRLLGEVALPAGYHYEWSGQSEYLKRAMESLTYIVPVTLVLLWMLIFLALRDWKNTLIVYLTLPFAAIGGLLLIWGLDYALSIAVIVGFLALMGIAAETAIVMMIYLDEAVLEAKERLGRALTLDELKTAVFEGAVLRVRPKLMTVLSMLIGLIPLMVIEGVGSEVMSRIAAPMMGGVISSTVLTLLIVPVIYLMVRKSRAAAA
ncbi:MAG: efflux RND transporter permease subunit [Campylobacterales bacterium]